MTTSNYAARVRKGAVGLVYSVLGMEPLHPQVGQGLTLSHNLAPKSSCLVATPQVFSSLVPEFACKCHNLVWAPAPQKEFDF